MEPGVESLVYWTDGNLGAGTIRPSSPTVCVQDGGVRLDGQYQAKSRYHYTIHSVIRIRPSSSVVCLQDELNTTQLLTPGGVWVSIYNTQHHMLYIPSSEFLYRIRTKSKEITPGCPYQAESGCQYSIHSIVCWKRGLTLLPRIYYANVEAMLCVQAIHPDNMTVA